MAPKLDKHQRLTLALERQRSLAGGWIYYGWTHYTDGSPSRFGWWHISDGNESRFLGQTFEEAEKALQSPTS